MLEGVGLSGTNVIVTGGHSGLGLETTRALSKAGASVTVGARNPDRAAAALDGIERVEIGRLDLLDPQSARRLLELSDPLLKAQRPAETTPACHKTRAAPGRFSRTRT